MSFRERLVGFGTYCQREWPLNQLLISHHGELVVAVANEPYQVSDRQMLFSMTKSITSLAIGIASDQGVLRLEDKVVSFFPADLPQEVDGHLRELTVRHLLMMSPGTKKDHYQEILATTNWVKAFLAQAFDCQPGQEFLYSTPSSHLLSAIISRATNKTLVDFLDEHLFRHMGIAKPQWETSPEGVTCGGMGLSLPPLDMLKIGELLLNKGEFQERQLISSWYLGQATSWQIQKPVSRDQGYLGRGYGYQFHLSEGGCYRLDGAFGQLTLISPQHDLVVVIHSRGIKLQEVLELFYEHVVYQQKMLPMTTSCKRQSAPTSAIDINWLLDRTLTLRQNCLEVTAVKVVRLGSAYQLQLVRSCRSLEIDFSLTKATNGQTWFIKDTMEYQQRYYCDSQASATNLTLNVHFVETPYIVTIGLSLLKEAVQFTFDINLGFTLHPFTQITK
nr:serine hydrolase [Vagococcus allomyrinae]